MEINYIENGDIIDADETKNNLGIGYREALLNTIRQLQDRSVDLSGDGGEFAEAYVDSDGRLGSVDTANTTAIYDSINGTAETGSFHDNNQYIPGIIDVVTSGSIQDPNSYTNVANAFDDNPSTYASYDPAYNSSETTTLGATFSSQYVDYCKFKAYISTNDGTSDSNMKIQTYNGSVWSDVASWENTNTGPIGEISGVYFINDTIEGIRLSLYSNSDVQAGHKVYLLKCGVMTDSVIVHDISSGTFSSTYKNGFLTALVEDWEDGANIQFKLTNAAEDTGYGDYNEILSASTAFTSEPTKLYVKLIPKSSGATSSYPSIKGVGMIGDK